MLIYTVFESIVLDKVLSQLVSKRTTYFPKLLQHDMTVNLYEKN